jgi:biopolymer transport protein TolR
MSMTLGSVTQEARRSLAAEMNVTPLIDVLLVLLIIFMVVLPEHHRGEKTEIPRPNLEKLADPPDDTIVIQLHDVGAGKRPDLKINQQDVAWDGLESRLQAIYQKRAEKIAFLKGDPEIDFEYVAEAVDITHRAGAERVGLMGEKN